MINSIDNPTILRLDSSARSADSVSRQLADRLIARIAGDSSPVIVERNVATGLPFVDEATIEAMYTPAESRTQEQVDLLALGQTLIDELVAADAVVISMPVYNFGPPATLKAWVDLIARVGVTFNYTEQGPVGALADKPVYLIVASGGTPIGSAVDWATGWLKQVLGFLGITSVEVISAGQLNIDPDGALLAAEEIVDNVDLVGAQ